MSRETSDTDQETLDRLVDGALDDAEYREVVQRLETEPDGWRRCALAFLEAEAWRRELAEWSTASEGRVQPNRKLARTRRGMRPRTVVLAIVATFLGALVFGARLERYWIRGQVPAQSPPLADERRPKTDRPVVVNSKPVPRDRAPYVREASYLPEGSVRLAVSEPADRASAAIDLPVYRWSPKREWMLTPPNPRVPSEIQWVFERAGREWRHERELVPLETIDGTQVIVPVERIELSPRRGRVYQ